MIFTDEGSRCFGFADQGHKRSENVTWHKVSCRKQRKVFGLFSNSRLVVKTRCVMEDWLFLSKVSAPLCMNHSVCLLFEFLLLGSSSKKRAGVPSYIICFRMINNFRLPLSRNDPLMSFLGEGEMIYSFKFLKVCKILSPCHLWWLYATFFVAFTLKISTGKLLYLFSFFFLANGNLWFDYFIYIPDKTPTGSGNWSKLVLNPTCTRNVKFWAVLQL